MVEVARFFNRLFRIDLYHIYVYLYSTSLVFALMLLYCLLGGLIMGVGIESSSHIHGLLQHCCVSFDIVLSDSSLATCSKVTHTGLSALLWPLCRYYQSQLLPFPCDYFLPPAH